MTWFQRLLAALLALAMTFAFSVHAWVIFPGRGTRLPLAQSETSSEACAVDSGKGRLLVRPSRR